MRILEDEVSALLPSLVEAFLDSVDEADSEGNSDTDDLRDDATGEGGSYQDKKIGVQ